MLGEREAAATRDPLLTQFSEQCDLFARNWKVKLPLEKRIELLRIWALRILFLKGIDQIQGSLLVSGLVNRWRAKDHPYCFHQMVHILLSQAACTKSARVRSLLNRAVGATEYLGPVLLATSESDTLPFPPPNEFWNAVLKISVVDPVVISQLQAEFIGEEEVAPCAIPDTHSVIEPNAGSGIRVGAWVRLALETGQDWSKWNIFCADELSAEGIRFRIALEYLRTSSAPWPDIHHIVNIGILPGNVLFDRFEISTENATTEFKASWEWDRRRQQKVGDLKFNVLRAIVAFLNSNGGRVWIGVQDDGEILGLEEEFLNLKDDAKEDTFEGKIREAIKWHVDPIPLNSVNISFPMREGKTLCLVEVKPLHQQVTYLIRPGKNDAPPSEELCVRDGNRTLNLTGRHRDQFVLDRIENSAN